MRTLFHGIFFTIRSLRDGEKFWPECSTITGGLFNFVLYFVSSEAAEASEEEVDDENDDNNITNKY